MRLFYSLREAVLEIRRDVYKGASLKTTRVQNIEGDYPARERLFYHYGIDAPDWPEDPKALVEFGREFFPLFSEHPLEMADWLEREQRLRVDEILDSADEIHPALQSTIEGFWPSYTYSERLQGWYQTIRETLYKTPDSRRAFWPIFRPEDSFRAKAPTRIPCSLGYQFLIRRVGEKQVLMLCYLSRSVDLDTFWLTDLWLARALQQKIARFLDTEPGLLTHFIVSFHSYLVEGSEIY